jgi:hypothetical protein
MEHRLNSSPAKQRESVGSCKKKGGGVVDVVVLREDDDDDDDDLVDS